MDSNRAFKATIVVSQTFVVLCVSASVSAEYPKRAPYSAVRWNDQVPEIRIIDKWYALHSIDSVPAVQVVKYCETTWPDKWQKRFEEDLVEVLSRMGKQPGRHVDLELTDLSTNQHATLKRVAMTEENRTALRNARRKQRPVRSRSRKPDSDWATLLTPEQIRADLDQLQTAFESEFSYLKRYQADYKSAIQSLSTDAANGMTRRTFAIRLSGIIAEFGDGHARVRGRYRFLPAGFLPFVIEDVDGTLVALKPDRTGLLDVDRPYLIKLDETDAESWIRAAAGIVANGSPQFIRRQSIDFAHWAQHVRTRLGKEETASITITLASDAQHDKRSITLPISGQPPRVFPDLPKPDAHKLESNIGYLRISRMDKGREFEDMLRNAIRSLSDTNGLIIDVRGNSGGSRNALKVLMPGLMAPNEAPRVVNVAAARIPSVADPADPAGYLRNRSLFPANWPDWSSEDQKAIKKLAATFRPEWQLPKGEFSDWHFMVVSPRENDRYDSKPVVVLMDERCFSATDIFLGALKGLTNVTLMGRPSGGGSGRSRQTILRHSGLQVMLSSMASFQSDGRLYDSHGIQPDIMVPMTLAERLGTEDTTLDRAIRHVAAADR